MSKDDFVPEAISLLKSCSQQGVESLLASISHILKENFRLKNEVEILEKKTCSTCLTSSDSGYIHDDDNTSDPQCVNLMPSGPIYVETYNQDLNQPYKPSQESLNSSSNIAQTVTQCQMCETPQSLADPETSHQNLNLDGIIKVGDTVLLSNDKIGYVFDIENHEENYKSSNRIEGIRLLLLMEDENTITIPLTDVVCRLKWTNFQADLQRHIETPSPEISPGVSLDGGCLKNKEYSWFHSNFCFACLRPFAEADAIKILRKRIQEHSSNS